MQASSSAPRLFLASNGGVRSASWCSVPLRPAPPAKVELTCREPAKPSSGVAQALLVCRGWPVCYTANSDLSRHGCHVTPGHGSHDYFLKPDRHLHLSFLLSALVQEIALFESPSTPRVSSVFLVCCWPLLQACYTVSSCEAAHELPAMTAGGSKASGSGPFCYFTGSGAMRGRGHDSWAGVLTC